MSILLICRNASAIITRDAETIEGKRVQRRHYPVREHMAILQGYPDEVLRHDADALLAQEAYRLPTPDEQERCAQMQRARTMIQE